MDTQKLGPDIDHDHWSMSGFDIGCWDIGWLSQHPMSTTGRCRDLTFWLLNMTFKGWILKSWVPTSTGLDFLTFEYDFWGMDTQKLGVGIWFFDFWVWFLRDGYSKAGCRGLIFWLLSMIFKGWILKRQTMTLPRKQKDKGEMTNN